MQESLVAGNLKETLAKTFQKLPNAYFVFPRTKMEWEIYLRNANSDSLVLSKVVPEGKPMSSEQSPLRKVPNFELETIVCADCPICGDALDVFHEIGKWTDPSTAFLYELSQVVNATLETVPTLGMVRSGKDEDGQWDEYTQSLLDGSTIVSAYAQATPETYDYILITHPYFFDSICFVYAAPQPVQFNPLGRLLSPFNTQVWVSLIVSVLATSATLHLILSHKNSKSLQKLSALAAILKPLFDQSPIDTKSFVKCVSNSLSRSVIAVWLLLLISLGCAYKSKMVELIALPKFKSVPTTFEDLANSNYQIMSIFFSDQVEVNLRFKNSTASMKILERTVAKNFVDPDCYQGIFEAEAACIGFFIAIMSIGTPFMVDINKQPIFRKSAETWYLGYVSMGISLNYPELLEPMDTIFRRVENAGLLRQWQEERHRINLNAGQKNAIRFAEKNILYKGENGSVNSLNNFSFLLLQILMFSVLIGSMIFTFEIASNKRRGNRQFHSCIFRKMTSSSTPVIFIS
ncbi:unnamed protein product [Allacma fusca]|uniref:Uncharacterized protein n=1 Tax=Allacma fusca TaxID=39272 RepID=A0A8J2KBN5_9HEXA|nr:unnamed protein product [Allacma fusca]